MNKKELFGKYIIEKYCKKNIIKSVLKGIQNFANMI